MAKGAQFSCEESAPRAGGGEVPRVPWPCGANIPTSEFGHWGIWESSGPHHEQVVEELLASLDLVARPDDDGAARHSILEPPAVRRALRNRVMELGLAADFWSLAALAIAHFSRSCGPSPVSQCLLICLFPAYFVLRLMRLEARCVRSCWRHYSGAHNSPAGRGAEPPLSSIGEFVLLQQEMPCTTHRNAQGVGL